MRFAGGRGRAFGGLVVCALASIVATAVVAVPAQSAIAAPHAERARHDVRLARETPKLDRDHLLVKFRSSPANLGERLAIAGARTRKALRGTPWSSVTTAGDAVAVRARLLHDPAVAQVEYSYIRRASSTDLVPNDPRWASAQRDYLGPLRMDRVWAETEGSGVTVAVVDTGVDFQHPDLTGRLLSSGTNELSPGAQPNDDNGHGTMVAGIIAANINNSRGVAGIAPAAHVLPIKVLGADGQGTDADIAQGILDAATGGARVINLSLGGVGFDQGLCDAVQTANNDGAVVVAAAGNEGDDTVEYPAACPGALAIAATNHTGALTEFSSYGTRVDLAAPGLDITSTALGSPRNADAYDTESGTSFASPIVAGVAALELAHNPTFTKVQLVTRLEATARDAGPPGKDRAFGFGIVDPLAAVDLTAPLLAPIYDTSLAGEEPNDTPGSATALSLNTTHSAAISPETDEDWYKVSLTAGWYTVHVPVGSFALDHFMDPIVELYDSNGGEHLVASQAFAGGDLTFHADTAQYFVRVRNRGGDTASYTVRVSPLATPPSLYAPPLDFTVDSTAQSVAVGDLTGDGRNDVAFLMGDNSQILDTLVVLDQTRDRSFTIGDVVQLPFFTTPGGGLVIADVNGDHHPDVVVPTSNGVVVYNESGGRLDTNNPTTISVPGGVTQVAVSDFDNDGHPDIATASNAGIDVWWGSTNFATHRNVTPRLATSLVADGQNLIRVAGSDVTEYSFTSQSTPTSINATVSNATNVAADPVSHDLAVTQRLGATTNGKVTVLHRNGSQFTTSAITLAEPNPDPVAVATIDGAARVVTLHDTTGDVGVVPLAGGTESLFRGDDQAMTRYDERALAVADADGDGAPDIMIGTLFGLAMVMHRLDALPENYGVTLVHSVAPVRLASGVNPTTNPQLHLNAASTNATTNVVLRDEHGNAIANANADGTLLTISPPSSLNSGEAYSVEAEGLHDAAGDTVTGYPTGFVVGTPNDTDVSLSSAPSGFRTTAGVTLSFSSHDGTATFMCSVDNADYTPCTSPDSFSVAPGPHTFRVYAVGASSEESSPVVASWTYRPPPHGYWMVGARGTVYPFGSVSNFGNAATTNAVDIETSPSGFGYWVVDAAGHVSAFGDAVAHGNAPGLGSGETVTSISRTHSGNGYWLFTNKGRAFPFGDAHWFGDMSLRTLNAPVLDSVTTPSGNGYYMVAADGGVFTFGDAKFAGSTGSMHLNAPVRTMIVDPDGTGYWLIASDGGVFAFKASFRGSMGGQHLNRPIVGGVAFGNGYLMVGSDGGIFDFSNKPFFGSLGGNPPAIPIVSVTAFA